MGDLPTTKDDLEEDDIFNPSSSSSSCSPEKKSANTSPRKSPSLSPPPAAASRGLSPATASSSLSHASASSSSMMWPAQPWDTRTPQEGGWNPSAGRTSTSGWAAEASIGTDAGFQGWQQQQQQQQQHGQFQSGFFFFFF